MEGETMQINPVGVVSAAAHVQRIKPIGEDQRNGTNLQNAIRHANSKNAEKPKGSEAPNKLSEEELKQIKELEKRDKEVKTHEAAHKAAAGKYAKGAPTYDYEVGPDGKPYAVGGEVKIDTSKEKTPEETIKKAQVIKRAANAPKDPSSKDRQVAADAAKMEQQARAEMAKEKVHSPSGEVSKDEIEPNKKKEYGGISASTISAFSSGSRIGANLDITG